MVKPGSKSHAITGNTVFRLPLGPRLFGGSAVAMCAAAAAFLTVMAVLAMRQTWALGLFVAAVACFVAGLTAYAGRDLAGKWGLRIALKPQSLVLDLPYGRSLIHRPSALHCEVAFADIASIETRLEAYITAGMGMMQRAYVLQRKHGEPIFLFEDRAIGTPYESNQFTGLAAEIAARAGVPLRDLGMAEGDGGVLAVWGTHAPDWAAPQLPAARQAKLWRAIALTGALPIPLIVLALMLRAWLG